MTDLRAGFGDFEGRIWLNCSHQGPLPLAAAEAAREAIEWKVAPHRLTTERFLEVPRGLRAALGRLVNVPPEEIVLANGSSYGIHLLANGLPLERGDEVLLVRGDFPSNVLPWLGRERDGIRVRFVDPTRHMPTVEEVEEHLTPRTRVMCLSHVHSFSGFVADIERIGRLCRSRGVTLIVNATQGIGNRPLDLARLELDAVVCSGWKWLCGPYATGFAWLRPEVTEQLRYNRAYWLTMQTADDLGRTDDDYRLPEGLGARRYDNFGIANFLNFVPWSCAVEHLLDIGIERIYEHDQGLVARLIGGIDPDRFEVLSPTADAVRSSLVFLTHRDPARNGPLVQAIERTGIDVAFRRGRIRVSAHLYNTIEEIDRLLGVLDTEG